MYETIRSEPLTPKQRLVLDENTLIAGQTGIVKRYRDTMNSLGVIPYSEHLERHGLQLEDDATQFSADAHDPLSPIAERELFRTAIRAEAPFVFCVEALPSQVLGNAASLLISKVDTVTGSELPESAVRLGFVIKNEYPAYHSFANHGFTAENIVVAVARVRAQRRSGLTYVKYGTDDNLDWLLDEPTEL